MATGETKVSALGVDLDPTGDDYALSVDVDTGTSKKVPFSEISKALDYSNSLSSDTDNLIALGTDDKIRVTAQDELISSDASNTISVGSDGKLYGSATALTLNENELFVGNVSNQPVSTSANDVKQLLGLPTDYIKDDIQYLSANQVSWQGVCRDSSDSRDFELGVATTASLVTPTANTTYNLFVAGNTLTDTPVVVWDTGSTPAGYTYYRRVLSIVTDGVGNIINFISHTNKDGSLDVLYTSSVPDYNNSNPPTTNQLLPLTVPSGLIVTPFFNLLGRDVGNNIFYVGDGSIGSANIKIDLVFGSNSVANYMNNIIRTNSNASCWFRVSESSLSIYEINTSGFKDERKD